MEVIEGKIVFKDEIDNQSAIQLVRKVAEEQGYETYLVGGYVRDLLLNRTGKDIDFVTVGSGVDLANAVGKEAKAQVTVFKNFGTAMLKWKGYDLEFVGARKESYRSDSRKPIVEDGSLLDDQLRRDFTINAMGISLSKENYGELIDPFGGMEHLKRKEIKTPLDPDVTFSEDPLRMMRAIRFATQLNFDIEAETFASITKLKDRISIVSQERITDELNKIIMADVPSYGFKLLFHSGLLEIIFPDMVALHGVERIKKWTHKDNFYHTLQVLDNIAPNTDNLWLRWSAILHDIAKPPTKRFVEGHGWTFHGHEDKGSRMVPGIFRKLKLPLGAQMSYVKKLVRLHLRPIALVKETITDSAVRRLLFEAGEDVEDLITLCKADVTSKNDTRVKKYMSNFVRVEKKMKEVEEKDKMRNFQPPISGEEIMEHFKIKPGPVIGLIKEEIKEAILDGKISNNKEDAWVLMETLGEKHGLKI